VIDVQPVGALHAEPLGQVQQGLGDPARHVGEDQVRHDVVGAAQPLREGAQQVHGDTGAAG